MGNGASLSLPSDKVHWRQRVQETHAEDVVAIEFKSKGIIYVSIFGGARERFFLIPQRSSLAFYVSEQQRIEMEKTAFLDMLNKFSVTMFNKPSISKFMIDDQKSVSHFGLSIGERLRKNNLCQPVYSEMKEVTSDLMWWGLYNMDVAMAVSDWIAMAENFLYGDLEKFALRWLSGERLIAQAIPEDPLAQTIHDTQKRIKNACITSLKKFIDTKAKENKGFLEYHSEATSFCASCAEVDYIEDAKVARSDNSENEDEVEKEKEINAYESDNEKDEWVILRVSRKQWESFKKAYSK